MAERHVHVAWFLCVPVSAHQSSSIRMKPYKIPVTVSSMTFSMKYKSTSVIHLKDDPHTQSDLN